MRIFGLEDFLTSFAHLFDDFFFGRSYAEATFFLNQVAQGLEVPLPGAALARGFGPLRQHINQVKLLFLG